MTWNIDPIIAQFGPFEIRYYGILFAMGFMFGYLAFKRMYRLEGKPLEDIDFGLYLVMAGTIVGARLGHCLFYEPEIYLRDPLRIFNITEGGLASHGGAIGVLISLMFYCRIKGYNMLWLCDRLAYPTALVGSLIRLGNFFNSEIIGNPTDSPLGVVFSRHDELARHPSMLYESASYFVIFIILNRIYEAKRENLPRGLTTGLFFFLIFTMRFILEFTKINQVPFEDDLPLNMGQLLSLPFIFIGIAFLVKVVQDKKSGKAMPPSSTH